MFIDNLIEVDLTIRTKGTKNSEFGYARDEKQELEVLSELKFNSNSPDDTQT